MRPRRIENVVFPDPLEPRTRIRLDDANRLIESCKSIDYSNLTVAGVKSTCTLPASATSRPASAAGETILARHGTSIVFPAEKIPIHVVLDRRRPIVTDESRDIAIPHDFTESISINGVLLIY